MRLLGLELRRVPKSPGPDRVLRGLRDAVGSLIERVDALEGRIDEEIDSTVRKLNSTIGALTRAERARRERQLRDTLNGAPGGVLDQIGTGGAATEPPQVSKWEEKAKLMGGRTR